MSEQVKAKLPEVEIEVVSAPEEPVEDTRSSWQKQGYLDEIALVLEGLEESEEKFLLPANIRSIIETVTNAKTVEDFDRYNDGEIEDIIYRIRHEVPQIENKVRDMMDKISRAQTATIDVDFI